MEERRGKTISITSRFPDFYNAENVDSLLYKFVDVFGQLLETTEADLFKVMRSHFVDTADNEGSKGFVANQKGDLDKILSLYLEALGGTSQLMQVNRKFYSGAFKDIKSIVNKLHSGTDSLSKYLRDSFSSANRRLLNRYHVSHARFTPQALKNPGSLAVKLLVAKDKLSQYLQSQLSATTRHLLENYDGSDSPPAPLLEALVEELNKQLKNPSFTQKNQEYFDKLLLPEEAKRLRQQGAIGEDRERLHRMLLEAAYPEEIAHSNIPPIAELEKVLIDEFNRSLQDPKLADFATTVKISDELEQETFNRLLLESAYPNEINNNYTPYRERLKGLIQILRRGAATKQGIIDLVAANLGIVGNSPAAQAAKEQIQLEEFNPELTWVRPPGELPTTPIYRYPLRIIDEFETENPNPIEQNIEIFLEVRDNLPVDSLVNVSVICLDTGKSVTYTGTVKAGDVLSFREDTAFRNGQPFATQGRTPLLPIGTSRWRFTAEITQGQPAARFDEHRFDRSTLVFSDIIVDLEIRLYKLNPGVFQVKIPWDIPGFTNKFDEASDHPRNQISGIIEKVKAAGVLSIINYEKRFLETHDLVDKLKVLIESAPLVEEHIVEEGNFDIGSYQIPYPKGIQHEIVDNFVVSGVFDYTGFDTLNRFA
ncbi:MAG: hypothetical protein AB1589_02655 [Cyanobacteriota bacterium]